MSKYVEKCKILVIISKNLYILENLVESKVYGVYDPSIDSKGRLLLPIEVRRAWGLELGSKLKLTARPDKCLVLLLPEVWEKEIAHFDKESFISVARSRYIEGFFSYTRDVIVDSANRLLIDSVLRKFAEIKPVNKSSESENNANLWMKGNSDRYLIMNDEIHNRQEKEFQASADERAWDKKFIES